MKPKVLIVHDDLNLGLKLASLVIAPDRAVDAHARSLIDYAAMSIETLRQYGAVLLMSDLHDADTATRALDAVARIRCEAPGLLVFIVARGGNERTAVRFIKAGASDYWPAHNIGAADLAQALRPLVDRSAPAAVPAVRGSQGLVQDGSPRLPGYRFLRQLSHSDAARVYLAQSEETGSQVALKIQMIEKMPQDVVRRFLRECELLSRLNHKSVADVIDFGATAESLYIALEYFPCGSLRDRLKNPLSEAQALEYVRQIAAALGVIHQVGIVHRDVKPSNCMLTDKNRLVLIDFGLARSDHVASDITIPGARLGSPYYVSPEQIEGAAPDARSDLYSLGCVFFEMLSGARPFNGRSLEDLLRAHQDAAVPVLPLRLTGYQSILNRLLAKQPQERFESTRQFLEALGHVRPIDAEPQESILQRRA